MGLFPTVKTARYLGTQIAHGGARMQDYDCCLSKARKVYGRIGRNVLRRNDLSTNTKVSFYLTLIRSVMILHQECQHPVITGMRRLEAFQMRILRSISKDPRHITKTTNESVRKRLGVPSVESYLLVRRLMWFRRVLQGGEATIAVRGALLGRMRGDTQTWEQGAKTSTLLHQLIMDIWTWINIEDFPNAQYVN